MGGRPKGGPRMPEMSLLGLLGADLRVRGRITKQEARATEEEGGHSCQEP